MLKKGASLIGLRQKYGIKHRKKFTQIHVVLKTKRKCPECGSLQFGREAVGIWRCKKCGFKIAGTAYDVSI
jgi:large subunit ribosomal protein L37Ae